VIAAGGIVLLKRRRISSAVIVGATAILIVVLAAVAYPFMAHNARAGQGWTISTNNEWNLFLGNTPYTPDYKTGHFGQREFDQVPSEAGAYLSNFVPHDDPSLATRDQRKAMQEAAVDYMTQHPGQTLYRVSNRARAFWGIDYTAARGIQDSYGVSNAAVLPLVVVEGGGYLLVIMLALTAPFVVPGRLRSHWKVIVGLVVAIMLPYLLAFALPKYHLPAIPLLIPIAALACLSILDDPRFSWAKLRRSALWWSAMVLVCAIQVELIVHLILLR
jgi:hypothetical protein